MAGRADLVGSGQPVVWRATLLPGVGVAHWQCPGYSTKDI